MKGKLVAFALVSSAILSGCGPRRYAPIEVTANDFDLAPLVGRWAGDYSSPETGRTGSIVFTLQPGEAAASGDIVMIPRNPARSTDPIDHRKVGLTAIGTVREVLTIHFVRKEDDRVIGMLDTYKDPDCACSVTTVFEGRFVDNQKIEGTFRTIDATLNNLRAAGSWKVTRVKRL